MTAQMPDVFRYNDTDYAIAAVAGDGLFNPTDHGLVVVMMHTACWRGFICTYGIDDERLVLRHLQGRLGDGVTAPKLDGKKADVDSNQIFTYDKIKLPINYTGGLLIGEGMIAKHYVHMGFHPAWKFERVHELVFGSGRLIDQRDLSGAMKQLRDDIASGKRKDPDTTGAEWVSRTFSLDYSRSPFE